MFKKVFLILMTIFTLSSCASIISGTKQRVTFNSNPTSASVLIDDMEMGKTPVELKLSRNKEHKVTIKLDGYLPYNTTLTKGFNAWYLGNILFGGFIGLIIDPITGAIYKLTPKEVNARLDKTAQKSNKNLHIEVCLEVDKNWVKIGQLEKQN